FFFSSRRRHTRFSRDWSSDVCSSDLPAAYTATFPHGGMIIRFSDATSFEAFTSDGVSIGNGVIGTPFAGLDLTFAGTPAAGDEFKINADSRETRNILNTIVALRQALEAP